MRTVRAALLTVAAGCLIATGTPAIANAASEDVAQAQGQFIANNVHVRAEPTSASRSHGQRHRGTALTAYCIARGQNVGGENRWVRLSTTGGISGYSHYPLVSWAGPIGPC